ncbi:transcription factor bHLH113-like isoform X2 [Impatiens glandulifera]|uniref:transcription factor bHLH113-like isoform X2 n=1 Tax=Impatiens glandulifera TaxID=253017 RepID=UPI001FB18158|nr:transcription factor bHLH113-like isoform X2 [Impatiens glandulifera]
MADGEGYDDGDGATFSQLLFDVTLSDEQPSSFNYSSNPTTMLCFGKPEIEFSETPPKSGISETTSSASSNTARNLSNKRINETEKEGVQRMIGAGAGERQRSSKKIKAENVSTTGREKVRREKLGERIAVLQQLVSPYGKTDTASVLHEAMGYIRFLHEQVQVLCSPYLQTLLPSPSTIHNWRGEEEVEEEEKQGKGLRSKGLCLIPIDCTLPLANENGADLWTSAMVGSNNNDELLFNH